MARRIRTTRQDIYVRLVQNAKRDRGSDEDETDDEGSPKDDSSSKGEDEYLFDYQYELFSFAAAYGYLNAEKIDEPDDWSQDIIQISTIAEDNPHAQAIEFIAKLVEIQEDKEPEDAWTDVLQYADGGLQEIADELETQEDFDLVRFVREADADTWLPRLSETIGDPEDVGAGL